jgi:hypothetical protein
MNIPGRLWFVLLFLLVSVAPVQAQKKAPVRTKMQSARGGIDPIQAPRFQDPDFGETGNIAIEISMPQSPAYAISKPAWNPPNVKYSGIVELTVTIGSDGHHTEDIKSAGNSELNK